MENDGGLSVGTLIDLIVTVLEHPTTQSLIRVILRIGGEALKQHIATRNERRKKSAEHENAAQAARSTANRLASLGFSYGGGNRSAEHVTVKPTRKTRAGTGQAQRVRDRLEADKKRLSKVEKPTETHTPPPVRVSSKYDEYSERDFVSMIREESQFHTLTDLEKIRYRNAYEHVTGMPYHL